MEGALHTMYTHMQCNNNALQPWSTHTHASFLLLCYEWMGWLMLVGPSPGPFQRCLHMAIGLKPSLASRGCSQPRMGTVVMFPLKLKGESREAYFMTFILFRFLHCRNQWVLPQMKGYQYLWYYYLLQRSIVGYGIHCPGTPVYNLTTVYLFYYCCSLIMFFLFLFFLYSANVTNTRWFDWSSTLKRGGARDHWGW